MACFSGQIPENYQPKYASPVLKMQVCSDALGRIVYFSGPHPGSTGDSTIWRVHPWMNPLKGILPWCHGPKKFVGQELGLADGAYSGKQFGR